VLDRIDRDLPAAKEKESRLGKLDGRIADLTKELRKRELEREKAELQRRLREVGAAANR
jgi:hypothetical protein